MADFKLGDVVRLKSGGPDMTITQYPRQSPVGNYDDRALCSWFDNGDRKVDEFPLEALEKE